MSNISMLDIAHRYAASSPSNTKLRSEKSQSFAKAINRGIPDGNCVYSGGDGQGQTAYAEYTSESTAADPIVRITGHSLTGDYDKTVHINDIDPSHATYPELCALLGHLQKTGAYTAQNGLIMGTPLGVDRGDYSESQDFIQKITESTKKDANSLLADMGEQLLKTYRNFIDKKSERDYDDYLDTLLELTKGDGLTTEEILKIMTKSMIMPF